MALLEILDGGEAADSQSSAVPKGRRTATVPADPSTLKVVHLEPGGDDTGGGGGPILPPPLPVGAPAVNARYVHWDHLGSTRLMTDEKGAVIARFKYYPFGHEAETAGGSDNRMRFTGHERDVALGLDYMLARYYSSSLSRFLSVDPVTGSPNDPQGWNRYAYVHNNPLALVDPNGEDDIYVFRPEATNSTSTWRAVQAQAPKFGNTVTIYNGSDATVARFSQAASSPDAHVVFSGHSVHDQSGTVGSIKLADGDVGTMTSTGAAPTAPSSVQASTVGLFGCQTEDMAKQFTSGTVTTVSSGSDGNTSLRALDDGAVAYSDALSRNRDAPTAARQADGAIQKSKDPQDRNGDKTVVQKQQGSTP